MKQKYSFLIEGFILNKEKPVIAPYCLDRGIANRLQITISLLPQSGNLSSVQGHFLLCSHVFKRFLQTKGHDQGEAVVTALMVANKIIERSHSVQSLELWNCLPYRCLLR
ncbi:hypothetical protein MHYP_G00068080 [Metynnis hypsauchen]